MSVAAGTTGGLVPADDESEHNLRPEAKVAEPIERIAPDADTVYKKAVEIDVSRVTPQIACPHTVGNLTPVNEVAGKPVQQVVIGNCTIGRLNDLQVAAPILKAAR